MAALRCMVNVHTMQFMRKTIQQPFQRCAIFQCGKGIIGFLLG